MKYSKLLVAVAVASVAYAGRAQAQLNCGGAGEAMFASSGCRITNTVSATVPTVARLSIDNVATTLVAPRAVDFGTSAGVASNGPTLTVSANAGYTLTASPNAASWSGPGTKPATDLKMNVGGGSYAALGQVGTATAATASTSYVVGYNTIYNWTTDIPGSYSLVVNYTLTAP